MLLMWCATKKTIDTTDKYIFFNNIIFIIINCTKLLLIVYYKNMLNKLVWKKSV